MKQITMPLEEYEREKKWVENKALLDGQGKGFKNAISSIEHYLDRPHIPIYGDEETCRLLTEVYKKIESWSIRKNIYYGKTTKE